MEDIIFAPEPETPSPGTPGDDTIFGTSEPDYIFADAGDDYVDGWTGNDTLDGWLGDDTMGGYNGNDYLYGYNGDDVLYGEAGNDYLYGEAGSDMLTGGAGADKFVFYSPNDGFDSIQDFEWEQGDKVQVSFGTSTSDFTFSNDVLYYGSTALASLQSGSGFIAELDITIV